MTTRSNICDGFAGTVGNTPLIKLKGLSDITGCSILAKAEYLNPGGSVKDRAAKFMITMAEKEGRIKPGGTIIEATAGNTGLGLVYMANSRGYKCLFTVPASTSNEKVNLLRKLGADVEICKSVPLEDPENFHNVARKRSEEIANSYFTYQFENEHNLLAHYQTTGPEVWTQTDGKVDAFGNNEERKTYLFESYYTAIVCAAGTGGTIGGTSHFLKEKNKGLQEEE